MREYWFALSLIKGIGGATAKKLVEKFGDIRAAFAAPENELLTIRRISTKIIEQLRNINLNDVKAQMEAYEKSGIRILTLDDAEYPAMLRKANDGPTVLFVHGKLLPQDENAIAVVGTRNPSSDAVRVAETLARELAQRNLTIISGLAIGIDTAAHRGALSAENGRTLAVLGSGLKFIHPRQNQALAKEIVNRGALISDLLPETPLKGQYLMARDRIISGLSKAVIVVEADVNSGSLDTAAKARRQGRIVFAVPGSPGTDKLIAEGAEILNPPKIDCEALIQRMQSYDNSAKDNQLSLW